MKALLLDTHVWLWLLSGQSELKITVRAQIVEASASGLLYLSPISMSEVALKHSRGRLELDRPLRQWLQHATRLTGLRLAPITAEIAAESAELPSVFHGDPADRIIAATARSEGLTLVTRDQKLLRLASRGYLQALAT